MAKWAHETIKKVVEKISVGEIVLPIIQRELVWKEDQMEMLFDSVLKGHSFGAIICIEEEKNSTPLFDFRKFIDDYKTADNKSDKIATYKETISVDKLDKEHWFVIDGQQRLQSFYIGLKGSYNGKKLYFDLFSDYKNDNYNFKFADKGSLENDQFFYSVPKLFNDLSEIKDTDTIADKIISDNSITDLNKTKLIEKNIEKFFSKIMGDDEGINISRVQVKKNDIIAARQQIMELFRRLNNGGTVLSNYVLASSMLKVFDPKMREFLRDTSIDNGKYGIGENELIKLMLILNDQPTKEVVNLTITNQDNMNFAKWVSNQQNRIRETLDILKTFLEHSQHYYWFAANRSRSAIPLYFLAYHIFHSSKSPKNFFDKFDTTNDNFKNMKKWLIISLLNEVFLSRGRGWVAYITGVNKIHSVLKNFKDKVFPADELIKVYENHPIRNFSLTITADNLNLFDINYILYLIYDGQSNIQNVDIDHIHPKSLLANNFDYEEINSVGNFQLLESITNRAEKRAKEFGEWFQKNVPAKNQSSFLTRHFIPNDQNLWYTKDFKKFLEERNKLLANKINNIIP